MPANRNALIRYKTIDKCLTNRSRKWTLEDLIDTVSDTLYEYEGIDKGVSKRTIQLDIQMMRSNKLGYNAPIVVKERKFYTYEDENYSINNIPINDNDLFLLKDIVSTLEQFSSFTHFKEFGGIIKKLEDQLAVKSSNLKPIIDFEKNDNLQGLEHVDILYQAIANFQTVSLTYKSFKAKEANTFIFHPQLLKEFNNRWFVVGIKKRGGDLLTFALDRIISIEETNETKYIYMELSAVDYYANVIGVTVHSNQKVEKIIFWADKANSPYIKTKPMHSSQQILREENNGTVFQMDLQINFELERLLLGFGPSIVVKKPRRLRSRLKKKLEQAVLGYGTD